MSLLARADTPHRAPVALAAVAGIQATTVVVQAVLVVAIARGSRPPVAAGTGIEERAIAVVATIDRRESGYITSSSNATHLIIGGQSPALGADVISRIDGARSLAVSSGGCGTEVIVATIGRKYYC